MIAMLRRALHRRVFGVALAAGVIVVCGVTATAYYISSGTGSNAATVSTLQTVTVSGLPEGTRRTPC